ncbi:hypothetical protein AK830_g8084 [Neonectria ditissima]|uniref:Uncharacterized protein n=1 Tax=Neonectria ditissima TaxID=78410 RepID=A0A0N8H6B2_9HYPO|nr:hypothetical protein AK830_g8084 [Neonectria ditissima]
MDRLSGRSDTPRRNTDDDRDKMQHWTPRGVLPAKAVAAQVREVADPRAVRNVGFPKVYENVEAGNPGPIEPYERRNGPETTGLYEIPVSSRMDFERQPARLRQVAAREHLHRNDRGRATRAELNDPGAFRGIVPTDLATGRTQGVTAVLYHPEGNARDFERARVEPLDREGRQYMRRFEDDSTSSNRVTTWPPRDEDASDLVTYENRHQQYFGVYRFWAGRLFSSRIFEPSSYPTLESVDGQLSVPDATSSKRNNSHGGAVERMLLDVKKHRF